ncbi:SDR family NAD(P)-dependent oxidoreductase [Chondromyces apiculatus]|uniref:Short-chain dehydrogenase/reductase SDR n=1 Tax=Chondromyces apiculatus DSM 436 TaxID=1192034 RepID=A0A017T836_9BACT|nr:SDR family NAD(P)-dependent oxidoreductase [Chondromyces apiculatus]EYF05112.1 short-chain dehydrogenase/reductase SDR [Chondromyces apiculatus DSM 436]
MTHARTARTWFITGAGRGLGRAFALAALDAEDQVVATARKPDALGDLAAAHPDRVRVLDLDVTQRDLVFTRVEQAIACFGKLDVVVNNAGHGLVAAVEEAGEAEVRAQMETNFFGALWVTQAVLPHLRARRSGHIVQISSVGGVGTMPTMGLYNASKWALEGFSEALAAEVAPFGIRVTLAELGGFATDWAWGSMHFASPLPAYDGLRESVFGSAKVPWDMAAQGSDTSADPAVAARALLAHLDREDGHEDKPLRLLIGDDAPEHMRIIFERRRDDYRKDPRFQWPT